MSEQTSIIQAGARHRCIVCGKEHDRCCGLCPGYHEKYVAPYLERLAADEEKANTRS